jgi:hypothetical protein
MVKFNPPGEFYAAGKVALVRKALDGAGHPISQGDARRIVALAWGYASWNEMTADLAEGYVPSSYDEDLGVSDFVTHPDEAAAMLVARRRGAVGTAVRAVTRLPVSVADDFSGTISLTDDPSRATKTDAPSDRIWLTPAQLAERIRLNALPPPPILAGLGKSFEASVRAPPFVPLLPGQRPIR